jgi:hypothetical protein
MKAEKEFVDKLCIKFSKYFEVQREVVSKCKKNRIDILLSIDGKYHFGIECKSPDKKRGEQIGRYVFEHRIYPGNRDFTSVHEVNYNFIMQKVCNQ